MSIITAENLRLSFGATDIFRGISFSVARDSKIGLIGPNGVGKTSLLLMLSGLILPSQGRVNIARGRKLGYLRQEAMDAFADRQNTVYAEMLTVFAHLQAQQIRLHDLELQMSGSQYDEALLELYGNLQQVFEHNGGYEYEQRIQQTLQGLGLGKEYWQAPLSQLSGGQKTRALLARLLLEKPDLLMLDEPTNHLDVDAVEWLEHTLSEWDGAVLIVSHDRYFLENSVKMIWEMSPTGIEQYPGGYSSYLLERETRWAFYERVFEEEKARLLKEVDFVQRNWVRASSHARAMGMLRKLSRELAIVEHYGIMALRSGKQWNEFGLNSDRPLDVIEAVRKVNAISMVNNRPPHLRARLSSTQTGGNIVLRVEKTTIGYPGNALFQVQDLELRRGECAALLGPNGSGKTTFLRTLLDHIKPLSGEVRLGAGLKIGYFAQVQDSLKGDQNLLVELQRHRGMSDAEARTYLARYLFRGEDVFKTLDNLSGGERSRLALAILALQGANFLLLDEPTNHLDIPAQEALQEVLQDFNGTVLLVSHDRYLIDRLASQIWEIRDGSLSIYHGAYREFMLQRAVSAGDQASRPAILLQKPLFHMDGKAARKRAQNLSLLEDRIHEQELAIRRLSAEMQKAGHAKSFEKMNQISQQVVKAQSTLESLMNEWESQAT